MVSIEDGDKTAKDGPVIAVEDLSKVYDSWRSDPVTAVDGVSLEIEQGSVVGVLGPNGAGKTTMIKCLLDLIIPTSGEIRIDGIPVGDYGPEMYRKTSAMLEGARNVYWRLTVRENIEFFSSLQERDPASVETENERLIEAVGLSEKADEPVNNLSRGMKQKTALICSLARRTPIIFLDEPTLGLDVEAEKTLLEELEGLLDAGSQTIVLTSHDMDVVQQLCDRVVILKDGQIVADEPMGELLDLFRTQAYRITIEEDIPTDERRSLERTSEGTTWDQHGSDTELNVVLNHPDQFYDLIRHLEEIGVTIKGVSTEDADLEEAFLQVIQDSEQSSMTRSTTQQ